MANVILVIVTIVTLVLNDSFTLGCSSSSPVLKSERNCGKCLDCPKGFGHIFNNHIQESGSTIEKWPWMVSLGMDIGFQGQSLDGQSWKNFCGGVIVNRRTILTAAHCFRDGHLDIRTGDEFLNDGQDTFQAQHRINTVIKHPNYQNSIFFDIAIVFTLDDIEFHERTRPICLPQSEQAENGIKGHSAYLAGWGREDEWEHRFNDSLLYTKLTIIPNDYCQQFYEPTLNSSLICAGDEAGSAGSCPGDSGGPLMKFDYEASCYKLVGILHGSKDACDEGDNILDEPGLYTRLEDPDIFNFLQKASGYIDNAHYNAMYGYTDEIVSFHSSMTNPNPVVARNGSTTLHIAAEHGQYYLVKEFLDKLDLEALPITDNQGQTPLHRAASKGHWYIVDLWRQFGLSMNTTDNNGNTPLDLAEQNGHSSIVNLFQET